jgi:integrating conjugative element protein (TIGR03756 family)
MKKIIVFIIFILPIIACANGISTITIAQKVTQAAIHNPSGNFLNYKIEGICFWLKHGIIPKIKTTLKVNHFLPDAVVIVYDAYKNNPWDIANNIIDPMMKRIGDTSYKAVNHTTPENNSYSGAGTNGMEIFKEADVIGDPGLFFMRFFPTIASEASPFMPYYSSLADSYFWSTPQWEDLSHPEYLVSGVRTEGTLYDQWGSIYPRVGYLNQLGDYKAAAVIALRASDIATAGGMTRIYKSLHSGSCGHDCRVWPSHENDFKNVKFQEIYPVSSTTAKQIFGLNDLKNATTYGQDQFSKGNGRYVFILWRHYEGCIQRSGKFLGEIKW